MDLLFLLDLNILEISLEYLMGRLQLFLFLFMLKFEDLKFLVCLFYFLIFLKKHIIKSVDLVLVEAVSFLELSELRKTGLYLFLNLFKFGIAT